MIKLPKHYLDRQNAIINAQNYAGRHTNYLNDVLRPAIERGNWDEFETLDIGLPSLVNHSVKLVMKMHGETYSLSLSLSLPK